MVPLFHVYHAERMFPHQHLGFICIVYFILFKQSSNLLSVFSDGLRSRHLSIWARKLCTDEYTTFSCPKVHVPVAQVILGPCDNLICVHSSMNMFDWSVPYAGSLEISLGNGLYVVLGVQSKILRLIVSPFSNA